MISNDRREGGCETQLLLVRSPGVANGLTWLVVAVEEPRPPRCLLFYLSNGGWMIELKRFQMTLIVFEISAAHELRFGSIV